MKWRYQKMRHRGVKTLVHTSFPTSALQCRCGPNSPSILEGVAEGRGSNIGIRIPCDYQKDLPEGRSSYVQEILVLILVLIIFNNVFPQIVQHYVHVL